MASSLFLVNNGSIKALLCFVKPTLMTNRMIIALLLAVAAEAVYSNTLRPPLIFSNSQNIRQNTAFGIEALAVNNLLEAASSTA